MAHWSAEFIEDDNPPLPIPGAVQTEPLDSTTSIPQFVPPGPSANPSGSQEWQFGSFSGDQGNDLVPHL